MFPVWWGWLRPPVTPPERERGASSANTLVLDLESWVTHHTSQEQALPGQCLASNILFIIQGEKKARPQRNQIIIYINHLATKTRMERKES